MSNPFVHEFLFRGRPEQGPGAGDPGWHVVLGQHVTMPGETEPQLVTSTALTPAQAEKAGFGLPAILSGINAAALTSRDEALAARDAAIGERDTALTERAAAFDEREAMRAERDAALAQLVEMTAAQADPDAVPADMPGDV